MISVNSEMGIVSMIAPFSRHREMLSLQERKSFSFVDDLASVESHN
jgi:hypothetical protein